MFSASGPLLLLSLPITHTYHTPHTAYHIAHRTHCKLHTSHSTPHLLHWSQLSELSSVNTFPGKSPQAPPFLCSWLLSVNHSIGNIVAETELFPCISTFLFRTWDFYLGTQLTRIKTTFLPSLHLVVCTIQMLQLMLLVPSPFPLNRCHSSTSQHHFTAGVGDSLPEAMHLRRDGNT